MIEKIKTVERLSDYVPLVLKCFEKHRSLFEKNMTKEMFIAKMFTYFNDPHNLYFGSISKDGELEFFCNSLIIDENDPSLRLIWFMYSNPKCRKYTYAWIDILKAYGKTIGIKEVRFITNRLTRSYRKFATKVGAKPMLITYTLEV